MIIFLIVLGLLAVVVGSNMLTQATLGVGVICGACFLLILARIAQAHEQHKDLLKRLDSIYGGGSST